jgi:hypothetical protein
VEFPSNLSILLLIGNFILLYFVCMNFHHQNSVVTSYSTVLEGLNFFAFIERKHLHQNCLDIPLNSATVQSLFGCIFIREASPPKFCNISLRSFLKDTH